MIFCILLYCSKLKDFIVLISKYGIFEIRPVSICKVIVAMLINSCSTHIEFFHLIWYLFHL